MTLRETQNDTAGLSLNEAALFNTDESLDAAYLEWSQVEFEVYGRDGTRRNFLDRIRDLFKAGVIG